ncbi:hypothetical protein GCM10023262_12480 [Bartonella pachyuromydis]|uniref:Uncharacterized protein n=1 Tax=Bartonella pachyuromydis TaxID=931097 RepID=A0ABP8VII6_9HYPH
MMLPAYFFTRVNMVVLHSFIVIPFTDDVLEMGLWILRVKTSAMNIQSNGVLSYCFKILKTMVFVFAETDCLSFVEYFSSFLF